MLIGHALPTWGWDCEQSDGNWQYSNHTELIVDDSHWSINMTQYINETWWILQYNLRYGQMHYSAVTLWAGNCDTYVTHIIPPIHVEPYSDLIVITIPVLRPNHRNQCIRLIPVWVLYVDEYGFPSNISIEKITKNFKWSQNHKECIEDIIYIEVT